MRYLAPVVSLSEHDWKHLRRQGIGGSDSATLLGHNPWRDPFCVYVDKVCDELAPNIQRESAYWGTRLEPLVAEEFQARHPEFIVHKPSCILGSSEHTWAFGSLDYLLLDRTPIDTSVWDSGVASRGGYAFHVGEDRGTYHRIVGVLEIKTTSAFYAKHWEQGVPPYAYTQLQHYLMVTDLSLGWVACLAGGQKFFAYECPRDEAVIAEIIEKGSDLMRRVREFDPPTPDPSRSDVLEALERLERSAPPRPKHPAALTLPGWSA